ncbi:hypothetical protein [Roseicella sp. DB1501]|uniref:hypothetical protein n=1 Tax=Roseicella sp. DB1501 TaxID=2730925 RepID=UPI0014930505|nr:hypothetical protein [Roseicella sp. DB1501]NOG69795.1 hypothetical protein [Roseicella sp. DB1501]
MDFGWLPGTLSQIATVTLSQAATLIGTAVAWQISQKWKAQEIGKRKQAVAEQAVLSINQFYAAMVLVREPIFMSDIVAIAAADGRDTLQGQDFYKLFDYRIAKHEVLMAKFEEARFLVRLYYGKKFEALMVRISLYRSITKNEMFEAMIICADKYGEKRKEFHQGVYYAMVLERWRDGVGPDPMLDEIRAHITELENLLISDLRIGTERRPRRSTSRS